MCRDTGNGSRSYFLPKCETLIDMKKQKKVLTKCVEAKKVQEFFNKISDLITSGHDKVWTSKDQNGEMNFIVGNSRVNIRINASMMEGGDL